MRSLVDIAKNDQSAFNVIIQDTGTPPLTLPPFTLAFDTTNDTMYFRRGAQLREIKLKSKPV